MGRYTRNSSDNPGAYTLNHTQITTAKVKEPERQCCKSVLLVDMKKAEGTLPCSKFDFYLVSSRGLQ